MRLSRSTKTINYNCKFYFYFNEIETHPPAALGNCCYYNKYLETPTKIGVVNWKGSHKVNLFNDITEYFGTMLIN